jgi:hypothetical protein
MILIAGNNWFTLVATSTLCHWLQLPCEDVKPFDSFSLWLKR